MTTITDYLMREALKADEKADERYQRAKARRAISGLGQDDAEANAVEAEGNFYRGQASGYRQATFVVLQHDGTPTHD